MRTSAAGRPPVLAFIPARWASTRFPGKPLVDLAGKPMIQRVWERASAAEGVDRVLVATDDRRIAQVVRAFGGEAVMTPKACKTGTERIAAALKSLRRLPDESVVINVQGDEPLLPPGLPGLAAQALLRSGAPMATLAARLEPGDYLDPNRVKLLWDARGLALAFSRSPLPYHRARPGRLPSIKGLRLGLHVGLYAYRAGLLRCWKDLPPSALEKAEGLEQLRVLEAGLGIAVAWTRLRSLAVDSPADAARVRRLLRA